MTYFDHTFQPGPDARCLDERVSRNGERIIVCRAERNSVLHDPTHPEDGVPTHWCRALENGWDCLCNEPDEFVEDDGREGAPELDKQHSDYAQEDDDDFDFSAEYGDEYDDVEDDFGYDDSY